MRIKSNRLKHLHEFYHLELDNKFPRDEIDALFYFAVDHYLGLSRSQAMTNENANLNQSEVLNLYDCAKELALGKPIQYVLGKAWFYGRSFFTDPSVLIPRPETEELVDLILRENKGAISLLDIGTGSGCIPVTLAAQLPGSNVSACDLSLPALKTAARNADQHHTKIRFFQCDVLHPSADLQNSYDLIVSNPPYILASEKNTMAPHVIDHEPHLALFAEGNDPIIFYRKIIDLCEKHLKKEGLLYFELNPLTAVLTLEYAQQSGLFSAATLIKDLSGKTRFLKAIKKPG